MTITMSAERRQLSELPEGELDKDQLQTALEAIFKGVEDIAITLLSTTTASVLFTPSPTMDADTIKVKATGGDFDSLLTKSFGAPLAGSGVASVFVVVTAPPSPPPSDVQDYRPFAACTEAELSGDFNDRNGFTLGDAVYVAVTWASGSMTCMGGDINALNGFTLGDAIFVAQVWAGGKSFPWDA